MLPDGCGSQILGRIREDKLASQVCIITGCAGPLLDQVQGMGAKHILQKPLEVDRLMDILSASR
jgi:DNA-binding response OmpR family regulator